MMKIQFSDMMWNFQKVSVVIILVDNSFLKIREVIMIKEKKSLKNNFLVRILSLSGEILD